ncbi:NAD(P)-binding domain-containing protein [uncultured Tenacibaculum sp.]|uniref:NAD(P)-binding domain-containing protein n=1 Tax=uncultured Tenacibaculum sp. TaxID=174713 RepID=UPI00260507EA|nr:NAD(P)-binding domain-containing protein [uncultured Tenacibaculum sp.]
MTVVIDKSKIERIAKGLDVVSAMEDGFKAYSNGKAVIPPVAELLFDNPKGETHIKYGYIKGEDYFVIKVASGFYGNTKLGLSSSQGMMMLSSQKTGETKAVLLDDGYLTNIRTAGAGALVAKYFAPKKIEAVGIIGAGIQARLQLQLMQKHTPCKEVWIWNKNRKGAEKFKEEFKGDFNIQIAENTKEVARRCNVIITTTPSEIPLLKVEDIRKGTHITAVGSDTPEKQELDTEIFSKAAIVVADSIAQSKSRGEIYQAMKAKVLTPDKVVELGEALQNEKMCRTNEEQISVVDLTGVAVQDLMIAKAVYEDYLKTLEREKK